MDYSIIENLLTIDINILTL